MPPEPEVFSVDAASPPPPPEQMPEYGTEADLVGIGFRQDAHDLCTSALASCGGEVVWDDEYQRWETTFGFEDGRSQRVFLLLEEPNGRAGAYLGDGHVLLTAASPVGPDTDIIDPWMLFRAAAQLYLTRVVSDRAAWGSTLRVRGSVPLAGASPDVVAALANEAAATADQLEETIFGSVVDDD